MWCDLVGAAVGVLLPFSQTFARVVDIDHLNGFSKVSVL